MKSYCCLWSLCTYNVSLVLPFLCYSVADITIPPIDTVGCLGGLSTFHCRMDRNNITEVSWNVDGSKVKEGIKQLRQITIENAKFPNGSEESYLYILGLPINDDIDIGCTVFASIPPHILTDSGLFTVTTPPPVSNVTTMSTICSNISSITTVTWDMPDCVPLNHTYIIIVTDYSNNSLLYTSIDEHVVVHTPSCSVYNISVMVTSIEQYNSSAVTIKHKNPNEVQSLSIDSLKMEFSDHNKSCYGFLLGTITGNVCSGTVTITTYQTHPMDQLLEVSTVNIQNQEYAVKSAQFQQTIGPLDPQIQGYVTLMFCDTTNSTLCEQLPTNNSFVTFHVQDLHITQLPNGRLELSCLFTLNSTAEGCLVVITAGNYSSNYTQTRESGPLLATLLPTGNTWLSVIAYDIVNGEISEHYSVMKDILVAEFSLINDLSTPSSTSTMQETVVMESSETVVMESSETVVMESSKTVVMESSKTVVMESNETVVMESSETDQSFFLSSTVKPIMSPYLISNDQAMSSIYEYMKDSDGDSRQDYSTSLDIIYIIAIPVVVVAVLTLLIVIVASIFVVRSFQAKRSMKLFTMHNANIEEVQRNPAYSTVHITSDGCITTVNDDHVNSINVNPSYASLKQLRNP